MLDVSSGFVYHREGKGDLTVKESLSVGKFIVTCSVCSQDKELWPYGSLVVTKGNLLAGKVGCGCSSHPKWKDWQYSIKISRILKNYGFLFLGFHGEYKGRKSKLRIYNPSNKVCWVHSGVDNLIAKGVMCPLDLRQSRVDLVKVDDSLHIKDFLATGVFTDGTVFKRNKSKYKRSSKGRLDYVYWDVICPLCESDEYSNIKNVFTASITTLKSGNLPCRCSTNYKWSEEENLVRMRVLAERSGYEFLGWADEYKGDKTKLVLKTGSDETWSTTTIGGLVQGYGHRGYKILEAAKMKRYSEEYYMEILKLPEGSFIERYNLPSGKVSKKVKFTCGICSRDEYTRNGVCKGVWDVDLGVLLRGGKPCRCTKPYTWTYPQREFSIKKRLDNIGGKFIEWVSKPEGKTSSAKFSWVCSNGTRNISKVYNFLSGSDCSCCNIYGFDSNAPAYLYLCKWYDSDLTCYKSGITNNHYELRIAQQQRLSSMDHKVVSVYYHEDGGLIQEIEKSLLTHFKDCRNFCPKSKLPDGFTETLPYSQEIFDYFQNISKGLVKIV